LFAVLELCSRRLPIACLLGALWCIGCITRISLPVALNPLLPFFTLRRPSAKAYLLYHCTLLNARIHTDTPAHTRPTHAPWFKCFFRPRLDCPPHLFANVVSHQGTDRATTTLTFSPHAPTHCLWLNHPAHCLLHLCLCRSCRRHGRSCPHSVICVGCVGHVCAHSVLRPSSVSAAWCSSSAALQGPHSHHRHASAPRLPHCTLLVFVSVCILFRAPPSWLLVQPAAFSPPHYL
jgi:hypothetical protein